MFSRAAYDAARASAAWIDRTDARGRIIVAGRDRATFLQGLVTNDTAALEPGQGCYAAMLTPQGRMIADLWVYELGDVMLLSTVAGVKDVVLGKLDQFIFSEDVQLGDVTSTFAQIAVVGPNAVAVVPSILDAIPADTLTALAEHGNVRASIQAQPAIITRISDAGSDGFDIFVERTLRDGVIAALAARGVVDASGATEETLRIEAGIPRFGRDMTTDTIPLEAGIESRAISFTKGCYVGQEVIIRVLHRGHGRVARHLVGLMLEAGADLPTPGTAIRSGDKEIGHVTSATVSPALGRPIGLAYVHRDYAAPGTALLIDGAPAEISPLPFAVR